MAQGAPVTPGNGGDGQDLDAGYKITGDPIESDDDGESTAASVPQARLRSQPSGPGGPSRPYQNGMSTGGNAGRSDSFNAGAAPNADNAVMAAGQDAAMSLSSEQFNAQVPQAYSQHSVLQQGMPSANGMSAKDYQRMIPGLAKPLPSANGTSQDSYEQSLMMRLRGLDTE
jgi:hypothetical protein